MPALTAAAVSRVLGAAGFPRTRNTPSMVRGMKERTAGYKAWHAAPGTVRVDWVNDSLTRRNTALDELTRIAVHLRGTGLDVDLYPSTPYLLVRRPDRRGGTPRG